MKFSISYYKKIHTGSFRFWLLGVLTKTSRVKPLLLKRPFILRKKSFLIFFFTSGLTKSSVTVYFYIFMNINFSPSDIPSCFKKAALSPGPRASRNCGEEYFISFSMTAILSLRNFRSVSSCFGLTGGNSSLVLEYTSESEFLRILSPSPILAASKIEIKKEAKQLQTLFQAC